MEPDNLEGLMNKVNEKKKKLGKYIVNPKVTLIMQFFNHSYMISQHVERIKKNKIIEEVIICEDGSSDDSLNLWHNKLKRRNDIIIRTNDYHEIISYNRAAKYANGEYLVFCQDDDLLPADDLWLRNAIKLFERDKKLGLIGLISGDLFKKNDDILATRSSNQYNWYGNEKLLRDYTGNPIKSSLVDIQFMYLSAIIIGPVIIKKELFHKLGGWDSNLSEAGQCGIGLDWDLSFRCWQQGYNVGCMPIKIKMKSEIKNNILEDKYFYYRYGFRGTCNFDPSGRNSQYDKNRKNIYKKINSFGPDFLKNIYNKINTLNNNLNKFE
jgi:hypothetical protein